jgi:threonine/homoserine/homoserine lactone efflux protein
MMAEAIGETLGYAIGIAVSPLPVAAVILMLFSGRARSNSVSFMVAWLLGIAAVTTAVLLIPGLEADDRTPGSAAGWIKLILGLALLAVAVRQWRSRPGEGDEPDMPGWMQRIDDLRPGASFGLGFLLSALNPKNLLLAAGAGVTIGSLALDGAQTTGAVAVFTVVAALTVAVPVVAYLVAGDRLGTALDRSKEWLVRNNGAVMAVLLVVFGFSLIGDGIGIVF